MRIAGLLVALLLATPARAECDAANLFRYDFGSQATTTLSYTGSYTYTAVNAGGAARPFTTSFAVNGLASSQAGGIQLPAISALIGPSTGGRSLVVGGTFTARTANIATDTRVIRTILTFAQPVRDLALTVHDIDFSTNQYRDWFMITGIGGGVTYTPSLSTPFGNNNGAGPRGATGSTLTLGAATTPYAIPASQAVGVATSPNTNSTAGEIAISFAQPVTSVTLRYGNHPLTGNERTTGQQGYGISAVAFCPLPALAVTKTSAPFVAAGPDRFAIPGADVVYAITVTNSGGSPVDLAGLVLTDILPTQAQFFNGDFDPAAPNSGPFQLTAGTSGVTLTPANTVFSADGGSTYGYVPAAGYDANVRAIRVAPGGRLAANASFTIRFRARIE